MSTPSTKPYLIRAIWQWCLDQGQTPYIVVAVDEHTQVPAGYIKDGQIVLNVGMEATNQLDMGNEFIAFQARFGGVAQQIFVPVERVAAIYSRESNEGMGFDVTETVLKDPSEEKPTERPAVSTLKSVEGKPEGSSDNNDGDSPSDDPTPPSGGNRPRFTVVK